MKSESFGELLRESVVGAVSSGKFGEFQRNRRDFVRRACRYNWNENPVDGVAEIGDRLAEMFVDAHGWRAGQRDNSSVAVAGALWENLVISFLNSILAGTSSVVIKGAAHVPEALKEIFTISSHAGIVSPSYSTFVVDHPCLNEVLKSESTRWGGELTHWLDRRIRESPELTSVVLLDSRTNFSDLIKETVLYDWLLNLIAKGHFPDQMSLDDQSIETIELLPRLRSVSISIVTGIRTPVKASSAPARRGAALTGRTFWGLDSVEGVAFSVSEFADVQRILGNLVATELSGMRETCIARTTEVWLG